MPALTALIEDACGAQRTLVYDVTRLVTRALNRSPNGIDRVDFLLARHFLSQRPDNVALICTLLGPRVAPAAEALETIDEIEAYWRESVTAEDDPLYRSLLADFGAAGVPVKAPRLRRSGLDSIGQNWRAMRRWALHGGQSAQAIPQDAVYFNASGFLLDRPWFVRWFAARPDVRKAFFIHDLLPLDYPEYFRAGEARQHLRRLINISAHAAGVVVGAQTVARRMRKFDDDNGRETLPVCVARLPASPVFATRAPLDAALEARCYFVVCGTIEPRKNHAVLLNAWRDLVARLGERTPKLVVVGKRGWRNQNVFDLLDHCAALRPHVIEVSGLSTPALCALLAGARALLMPSFDEGFGLPLIEGLTAGAPVVASDIAVFREIGGAAPEFIAPLDGLGWREAIEDFAQPASPRRAQALARIPERHAAQTSDFLAQVDAFVARL